MQIQPKFIEHQRIGIGHVENNFSMDRPHYHDTYEIMLIESGERNITIENVKKHLTAGDMIFIEPYIMHIAESEQEKSCRRYTMNIFAPIMSSILSDNDIKRLLGGTNTFVTHLDEKELDTAIHILDRIYNYFNRKDKDAKKLIYCAIYEIIDFVYRIRPTDSMFTHHTENNAVLKALQYVHTNYYEQINLDFVADYVNMSKSNFCLVFKKTIGETFADYLNHVRVSHVHRLLLETDLSLKEIAENTGFTTASYMTSVFKKFNNITPSKLRKIN